MHPVLDRDRFMTCEDLIDALEECHRSSFFEKAFGKCNIVKQDLTNCLHNNRLAGDRAKIIERRKKNKEMQEKIKKTQEIGYGKDNYLKEVVEKEYQLRLKKEQEQSK